MSADYRFQFHGEPITVFRDGGVMKVKVALGQLAGEERFWLNVGDGYRNDGDIEMGRDGLANLIDVLMEHLGEMDARIAGLS